MPLLPIDSWAEIFQPFTGRRARYVPTPGDNTGDRLIDAATLQLFAAFSIRLDNADPDVVFLAGGGNLGTRWWPECAACRTREIAAADGLPVVILPQTYIGGMEQTAPADVWVREKTSLAAWPGARLAPDLALAYTPEPVPAPILPEGVFLRHDCRPAAWIDRNLGDPVRLAATAEEYVTLAARFERLITNRLHFAIAGMLCGREVHLLDGTYWKNRAVWEYSLESLGCRWAD